MHPRPAVAALLLLSLAGIANAGEPPNPPANSAAMSPTGPAMIPNPDRNTVQLDDPYLWLEEMTAPRRWSGSRRATPTP